jgi:DUF4097 and DUF4098 domain-containing protein YvlB
MKHSILIVLGCTLASLIAIPQIAASLARSAWPENNTLSETDEIRQTFKLAPGTRVEIFSIRGPVDIETSNNDTAEILITRTAESRAALQQDKILIENKSDRLIVRGEVSPRAPGKTVNVSQHAKLKVPLNINLTTSSIGGPVQLGDLDGKFEANSVSGSIKAGAVSGMVQMSSVSGGVTLSKVAQKAGFKSISGDLNIAQVGGPLDISGVSGPVTLDHVAQHADIKNVSGSLKIGSTDDSLDISGVSGDLSAGIAKLGTRGIQISNVSGEVELRFKGEVDAQFSAKSISRPVSVDLPNVSIEDKSAAAMRARIGKGGPPISINSVSGAVRLLLDTQTRSQE